MDAELKAKWLEAMESGRFTFLKRSYRNNGCHCAVGVLLEIAGKLPERDGLFDHRVIYDFLVEQKFFPVPGSFSPAEAYTEDSWPWTKVTKINDAEETTSYLPVIAYVRENL